VPVPTQATPFQRVILPTQARLSRSLTFLS